MKSRKIAVAGGSLLAISLFALAVLVSGLALANDEDLSGGVTQDPPAQIVAELPALRTATSQTFELSNGEREARLYESPVNYRDDDFVEVVKRESDGHGADVILDNMAAKYLQRNVDTLALEGRLVVIGMQGGTKGELDLGKLLRKRGAVIATALRSRPVEGKAAICAAVVEHVWPLVADGTVRPIIGARIPLAEAGRAHALMESGESSGKILLTVS